MVNTPDSLSGAWQGIEGSTPSSGANYLYPSLSYINIQEREDIIVWHFQDKMVLYGELV